MLTKTVLLAALLAAQLAINSSAVVAAPPVPIQLTDITERAGISFRHVASPDKKYIVESMSGGVALFDYDNDGLPDIFFAGNMVSSRLYRNKGKMQFEDITAGAGVGTNRWATGVSMVDINDDGFLDIYVSVAGRANSTLTRT